MLWTWRDSAGAFLRALEVEDNVMFVILSILVLIAAMNIVSGLIMLVKNKGRDIGILRTMGLTEGSVLRVFFICGASVGVMGTALGRGAGLPLRDLHRPDLLLRELGDGRRSGTRRSAASTRCPRSCGPGRAVGGGAVAGAVLRRHDLSGAAGGADEPGRGAAL
jgi:hypothetical protein